MLIVYLPLDKKPKWIYSKSANSLIRPVAVLYLHLYDFKNRELSRPETN